MNLHRASSLASRFLVWAALLSALGSWPTARGANWPSLNYDPPSGWTGPVFKLSQDFPTIKPPAENKEVAKWLDIEPNEKPLEYLNAVLDYCFTGLEDVDFVPQQSTGRKWYHVPYMHIGRHPREFIHGMTEERSAPPLELGPGQTARRRNFAVGLYNALGGFAVGKMWGDDAGPKKRAVEFPEQSVTFKLLFTSASTTELPWLQGAPEWLTDIRTAGSDLQIGQTNLRLLQVDVAVKDKRSKCGGWIFGTFEYDMDSTAAKWRKLRPVTLLWGNDHHIMESNVASGTKLTESWVNPESRVLKYRQAPGNPASVPKVLGYAGRGNGPVDNPLSSCLSCHSIAQYPNNVAMAPSAGASENDKKPWFRNLAPGEAFTAGRKTMDFSLQLAASLQNWDAAHPTGPSSPLVPFTNFDKLNFVLQPGEKPSPRWKGKVPQQVPISRGD